MISVGRTLNPEGTLLQTLPTRRKRFVSIRNEVRDHRGEREGENEDQGYSTSVHYLASQYLADSSLSADVSNYDFAASASTVNMLDRVLLFCFGKDRGES